MFVPLVVEPGEVNILKINQEFIQKEEQAAKSDKPLEEKKSNAS